MGYGDDIRPQRPGKPPRRSPVVKLGATAAESALLAPGPTSYNPVQVSKERAAAWSMSDRHQHGHVINQRATDASPGPVYALRSSLAQQFVSTKNSSPRYGFSKADRLGSNASASIGPGPAGYSPRVTTKGAASGVSASPRATAAQIAAAGGDAAAASQVQLGHPVEAKSRDRSLVNNTQGPGPGTYLPRAQASCGPSFSIGTAERVAFDTRHDGETPGPQSYAPQSKSRYGGGQLGDSPAFSLSVRSDAQRFISKEHVRAYQGLHSPSPQAYTPREALGITNYTISNTSTHAPMYSFGTEARNCGEDPHAALDKVMKRLPTSQRQAAISKKPAPSKSPRLPRIAREPPPVATSRAPPAPSPPKPQPKVAAPKKVAASPRAEPRAAQATTPRAARGEAKASPRAAKAEVQASPRAAKATAKASPRAAAEPKPAAKPAARPSPRKSAPAPAPTPARAADAAPAPAPAPPPAPAHSPAPAVAPTVPDPVEPVAAVPEEPAAVPESPEPAAVPESPEPAAVPESPTPAAGPEPAEPEPATEPEPAAPEPEPAAPEPVTEPEPAAPEPAVEPEPAAPEPVTEPEPAAPEPAAPVADALPADYEPDAEYDEDDGDAGEVF